MKKILLISALCTIMVSCKTTGDKLVGSWVQPIPGQEEGLQGMKLEKGGKASSINMATLLYENWERQGDKLILKGKSVGNRQTIEFADTVTIKTLSDDILILDNDGFEMEYSRAR